MNRLSLSIAVLAVVGLPQSAYATSEFEAFMKENTFDAQAAQQEFQDYLDANDREFVGFLKQQWKKVELETPKVLDKTPKPVQLPKAPIQKPQPPTQKPKPVIATKPIIKNPEPIVQIQPIKPKPVIIDRPAKRPVYVPPQQKTVEFTFIGHQVTLPKMKRRPLSFQGRPNSKTIARHWESMAKQKHDHVVKAIQGYKQSLNLNDWAAALLAFEYSKEMGLTDTNSQQLLTWFLLVKAGYDARLAYNSHAFVLMPSQQGLYGVTYFTMKGQKYYAVSLDGDKIDTGRAYTYSGKHDSAKKTVDFSGASELLPSKELKTRNLSFKFNGESHSVKLKYDLALVNFSNTLPQMGIQYYPQQGLPDATSRQLLKQLQPLVKGKTELEAVNLLLRFVQTAFSYKTDGQQFNQENYLLPIETLHYPYSDCEDRASLFSWLVESLLGLDAVLLDYPGHIAAAVRFTEQPNGDKYYHNGKIYTVTDPTYINASAGMSMPQFKNNKPKVINF
jgi:hypothetical protein